MNASGVIEPVSLTERENEGELAGEGVVKPEFVAKSSSAPPSSSVSRYRRLAESRSITPSPTPLLTEPEFNVDTTFKVK